MLCYYRVDLSKGIDVAKSHNSKECIICHYWFFNHGFKFQDSVCYGFHDLTILCVNKGSNFVSTVKSIDYHCIIHDISKSEAIHLLENSVFDDC